MPKRIALPDGSIGEFPDEMDDAAIKGVLQKKFPPPSSRPAGLPAGASLPGLPTNAPMPAGMTSNRPGDSGDWRARLFGNDGSEMLKTPARHVKDAALGLVNAAVHPIDTAKAAVVDPLMNAPAAIRAAKGSGGVANAVADAIPVIGPWARQVENDAAEKGVVPAMLGLGADVLAPQAAGKLASGALRGSSTAVRLAGSSPESAKLAATKLLVPGDAGDVLQRALKPGVKYGTEINSEIARTIPDVLKQNPKVGSVSEFRQGLDAAEAANAAEHASVMAPYKAGTSRLRINGNSVMQAQQDSLPNMAKFEGQQPSPLATSADSPYNRWIGAGEADDLRQSANQNLHGFYEKSNGNKYAALGDPETARVKAVGDSIREQLYPAVEADQKLPAGSIAERQMQYGRLKTANEIAGKRETVFGRHDPVSLPEKLALGHGGPIDTVWNYALQKAAKGLTDSDALVRSAVDRYQNPAGTPLVAGPIADSVARGLSQTGKALRLVNPLAPLFGRRYARETK